MHYLEIILYFNYFNGPVNGLTANDTKNKKRKQTMRRYIRFYFGACLLFYVSAECSAQMSVALLQRHQQAYNKNLSLLQKQHPQHRQMPAINFYLFGMGNRKKLVYKNGCLINAISGDTLYRWHVKRELIAPSDYYVYLQTVEGKEIHLYENETGVYLKENKQNKPLSLSRLQLPDFNGHLFAPVLKVLHHEILINILDGKPLPNFLVYKKPWYRDATLMAKVLQQTGNLHLIKDWVMAIRDPFDRNNHGMSEADNPGEVLFLISLVSDASHPAVKAILDSTRPFIKEGTGGPYLEGSTDYSVHPVFQTKWIKYGLKSLHLHDSFRVPKVYDSYSSLFWWDYKNEHVAGARFDQSNSINYPYLVWAEDHFFGEQKGMMSERAYPLSWEAHASDAGYPGMKVVDEKLVAMKLSLPHTWHAAEMFLLLVEQ